MSVYVIHSFDGIYGGLYGMEMWSLEELPDIATAKDVAKEMSCAIIRSHSDITDILYERAEDYVYLDMDEGRITSQAQRDDALRSYYDTCANDDIAYCIIKLDPSYTIKQYNEMLTNREYDYEELADTFGVEEY